MCNFNSLRSGLPTKIIIRLREDFILNLQLNMSIWLCEMFWLNGLELPALISLLEIKKRRYYKKE